MSDKNKKPRLDGLQNVLTAMGTTRDKAQSTTTLAPCRLSKDELEDLYEGDKYAGRIIDSMPNDCVRRGWKVVIEDDEDGSLSEQVAEEERRLGLRQALCQADKWAGLYGGGAVVLSVLGGGAVDKELVPASATETLWTRAFNRWELEVVSTESDFLSAEFGEVDQYRLNYNVQGQGTATQLIHASRVLRFDGLQLPSSRMDMEQGWSASKLRRVWDAIRAMGTVEQGSENAISDANVFWVKLDLGGLLSGPEGEGNTMARLQQLNECRSIINAMVLDSDEDVGHVTRDLGGFAEMYDRFARSMAAAAEMPETLLFGQSPGGLSTDDAGGRTYWYDRVSSRQENVYSPLIARAARIILATMGVDGERGIEIEFTPLFAPSEQEEAATAKTVAETDALHISWGVRSVDEIRERDGLEPLEVEPPQPVVAEPPPFAAGQEEPEDDDAEPEDA